MATVWKRVLTAGTDAGTPSAIDLTNATNIPAAQLTGTIADARMPDLTGDVTTSAGAVATTLADNVVTLAKMAPGTDGNIISYDANGDPVAIATGSDGQVLTSAGANAQPAFETLSGLGDVNEYSFKTIAVDGETDVVADTTTDTLTFVEAGGMSITTSGDTITFTSATNAGDVTGITAGEGITGSSLTGPVPTITLDLTELAAGTQDFDGDDAIIYLDDGTQKKMTVEDVNLGVFKNDQNWTSNAGDITAVTAGAGLSGGGTSSDVTLAIDVSEFSAVTPASGDSFLTLDSNGSTEQRTTVDALATLLAGSNLSATNGVLAATNTTYSANQVIDWTASGAGTIHTDNYVENVSTSVAWTNGTTAGPTLVTDGNNVTIPAASSSYSGVIVTGPQSLPGNFTVTGDLAVNGDFTVSGTNTVVLAEELKVEDNVIVLNSNWASNAAPTQDAGITIERGTLDDESFFWDESNNEWAIGHTESSNVFTVAASVCTAKEQTYDENQTHSHGAFAIGSFQIDGNDIWMRTS